MKWLALLLILGGGHTHSAEDCPAEQLVHAKRAYAPIPYVRGLLPECDRLDLPTVQLHVAASGRIRKARVLKGSGCSAVDQRLLECTDYWRFEPARCESEPVSEALSITINWHLEERPVEDDPCKPEGD